MITAIEVVRKINAAASDMMHHRPYANSYLSQVADDMADLHEEMTSFMSYEERDARGICAACDVLMFVTEERHEGPGVGIVLDTLDAIKEAVSG